MPLLKPRYPRLQTKNSLANGVVGAWPLSNGGGVTFYQDYSGKFNNATTSTPPTWTAGLFGPCLNFSGSSQYINTPVVLGPSWSILALINFNSSGSYKTIFGSDDGTNHYLLDIDPSSNVYVSDTQDSLSGNPVTGQAAGVWYRIGLHRIGNGVTNGLFLSLNGAITAIGNTVGTWVTAGSVRIGGRPGLEGSQDWNGLIDAPVIYNRALTPSELVWDYQDAFRIYRQRRRRSLNSAGGTVTPTDFDWGYEPQRPIRRRFMPTFQLQPEVYPVTVIATPSAQGFAWEPTFPKPRRFLRHQPEPPPILPVAAATPTQQGFDWLPFFPVRRRYQPTRQEQPEVYPATTTPTPSVLGWDTPTFQWIRRKFHLFQGDPEYAPNEPPPAPTGVIRVIRATILRAGSLLRRY